MMTEHKQTLRNMSLILRGLSDDMLTYEESRLLAYRSLPMFHPELDSLALTREQTRRAILKDPEREELELRIETARRNLANGQHLLSIVHRDNANSLAEINKAKARIYELESPSDWDD